MSEQQARYATDMSGGDIAAADGFGGSSFGNQFSEVKDTATNFDVAQPSASDKKFDIHQLIRDAVEHNKGQTSQVMATQAPPQVKQVHAPLKQPAQLQTIKKPVK